MEESSAAAACSLLPQLRFLHAASHAQDFPLAPTTAPQFKCYLEGSVAEMQYSTSTRLGTGRNPRACHKNNELGSSSAVE